MSNFHFVDASNQGHEHFLELCALSTSGELTDSEREHLGAHLSECQECREAMRQFSAVVDEVIPAMAALFLEEPEASSDDAWSRDFALSKLLNAIPAQAEPTLEWPQNPQYPRLLAIVNSDGWRNLFLPYAAGILLFAALSVLTYRIGIHRGGKLATVSSPPFSQAAVQDETSVEAQLSDTGHELALARAKITRRDRIIADLKRKLRDQSEAVNQLRTVQEQLQAKVSTDSQNQAEIVKEEEELAHRLETAENNSRSLQGRLEIFSQESARDAARAKTSEAKVKELTQLLQGREAAIEEQEQMLAHDRDIRELMGARDLYITEVYDVGDRGETKKPYGRVFYTRGKSLIFYAYDLTGQAELKSASTFQAWGRRGPDREHAVNLGIFYEDNTSRKRWVMKCNDPRTLAQIDEVFVTIEPSGGSHKPSEKTLLFAYLKVNPNHP